MNIAYAQAQAAGSPVTPPVVLQFLPIILIFVVFYFLLIRPQQKKQKEHEKLITGVQKGNEVVTQSGIFGTVVNVDEKTVVLKVDDNTTIKFLKSAVSAVIEKK